MPRKKEDISDEPIPLTPEEENNLFKQDGVLAMWLAQNRKLNEMAKALNAYTLQLDGDDKAFERWVTMSVKQKEILDAIDYVKALVVKEYGSTDVNEDTLQSTNILERHIQKKGK